MPDIDNFAALQHKMGSRLNVGTITALWREFASLNVDNMKELELTKRTLGALDRAGIRSVEDLRFTPYDVLAKIPGIGRTSIIEIRAALGCEAGPVIDETAVRMRQTKQSLRHYRLKVAALEEDLAALEAQRRADETRERGIPRKSGK